MTTIRSAAVAAVLAGAAVIAAAPAQADVTDYLDTMHTLGFYNADLGDAEMVRAGYIVCGSLSGGMNFTEAAELVYDHSGESVDWTDAQNVVLLAVHELCPPPPAI